MKKLIIILITVMSLSVLAGSMSTADAVFVNGYYRSSGTYVKPYYRSRANAYTYDNYSYRSPSYSNGYGYNSSYYNRRSYSSNWYTPSFYDYDYSYGYSSYLDY